MQALPSPADWLQFGALGLLGLVCSGCFAVAMYLARAVVRALERMNVRMDKLSEAVLLLKDPTVRSYLEQLRAASEPPVSLEPPADTPRRPPRF